MKKAFCILMAIALLVLSAACLAEATGPAYLGTWDCGRCTIVIKDEHPGYRVEISWGNSAAETSEWNYYCPYELVDGSLVSEPTGVMMDVTYGEDGEVAESITKYEDGQATFTLGSDGKLTWTDAKENAGEDMAFERTEFYGVAPEAEDFDISYFKMIADSELTLDKKACEALNFAATSELWHADEDAVRDVMRQVWAGLTEAEQTAFNESFAEVSSLLDASFEDWTANRDAFKDGREARMDELITEPMYRNAWNVLKAATLAMAQ